MMWIPGILLCIVGLGLVALSGLPIVHIGALAVLSGVVWLTVYMVLHEEEWEKTLRK